MTKLKNSNCDKTKKLKFGHKQISLKTDTQIVMKLKKSNCDETQNSICDETLKLKL